jgi:hypothetical protein
MWRMWRTHADGPANGLTARNEDHVDDDENCCERTRQLEGSGPCDAMAQDQYHCWRGTGDRVAGRMWFQHKHIRDCPGFICGISTFAGRSCRL